MSIRVFISHSTWLKPELDEEIRDLVPAHAAFRDLLCERLREVNEPKIEVVIDKEIPAARFWRDFLFNGIAECNAAIVLLNKQALYHSDWVETEVSVLGYRAITERDFFSLIVVPFGGVKATDIAAKKAWEAIALSELQVVPRSGFDEKDPAAVEELVKNIVDILNGQLHPAAEAQSGWLVTRLCSLLPSDSSRLKSIASELKITFNQSDSIFSIRRRIGHFLYSNGPLSLIKLVKCTALPQDWDGLNILAILGTYWVDIAASIGVLSSCKRDAQSKVIAINGEKTRHTPQTYVRQVCGEVRGWLVIDVDPTDPQNSVCDQIRDTLCETERFQTPLGMKLKKADLAQPDKVEQALNSVMGISNAAPVFATFLQSGGGNVDDIIRDIHTRFPHICIIVCTGTKPGTAPVLPPEVAMLTPELDLDREAAEFDAYCSAATYI